MKLKNKLSILLTISPIMVSPLFLAASCKEKDKNNPQLKEFKDKLEKLQNNFDDFIGYVENSSVTNAKAISSSNEVKSIKNKIANKLNKLSKVDNAFLTEIQNASNAVIKKFKDALLTDLFNLNINFNNSKFWATFKEITEGNLDTNTQEKINSYYSTIKNLNYNELSDVKFDNSSEDKEILENIEEKLSAWNQLKDLVSEIGNKKIKEKLSTELNNGFAAQILNHNNDKMLKAFKNEYNKIKELSDNIASKELVTQKFLFETFKKRLKNLYELSNIDISNLDKTVKERFDSLVGVFENQFDVFDTDTKAKFTKMITEFKNKISATTSTEDLDKFLERYLTLLEKETYKWMLESLNDIFLNENTEYGKIFKELNENINKSNNPWLKSYFDNTVKNLKSLQNKKDEVKWYEAMDEVAKLTSLIENVEVSKKTEDLRKILGIFEKNKVYDFELDPEIANLKLNIKETYEEAKKIYESPFSSKADIEKINKKLNDILLNEIIKDELKKASFKQLLQKAKTKLLEKVDSAFDTFEAELKGKSNNPEKISQALKTLIQAQKSLYEKLLEAFEEPFIKIRLSEKDYPKVIETLEALSLLINDITIEVLQAAIQNKDSIKDGIKFLNEILTKEFIKKMLKKMTDFIANKGDILLSVIETIFTRLREVKELKGVSILEGVIKESIDFYQKYVRKTLIPNIANLNIESLTLDDLAKLEQELAPLVLEFQNMWSEHWRDLEQKFPGKGDELDKIGREWNALSGEMFSTMKSIFGQAVPLATAHMKFFNEIIKYLN